MKEIMTRPGNWVFYPTAKQIKNTLNKPPHRLHSDKDARGREMFLIQERGVLCPDLSKADQYPITESGECFVPASICRKCAFQRQKKGRRTLLCAFKSVRPKGE